MPDQDERCTFEQSGFCVAHQSEIDRREAMEKIISKLWDEILPSLMTKMNWTLGVLTLVGIFVLGSYTYTYITDQNQRGSTAEVIRHSDKADDNLRVMIAQVTKTVNTLAQNVSYQQAENKSYLREFSRLNDSLEKLVNKQSKHEEVVERQLDEWWSRVNEKVGG